METVKKTATGVVAQMKSSPKPSGLALPEGGQKQIKPMLNSENGSYELSVYCDSRVTDREVSICNKKLQMAFPAMSAGFFNILTERIHANRFTVKRLEDATAHVIDNFRYKELNVSDIIRFDRRAKLYSYNDVIRITGQFPHPDFERRTVDGQNWYVRKTDLT
jgi:hypothetical protein